MTLSVVIFQYICFDTFFTLLVFPAGQLQLLLAKNQHMQNIYEQQDLTPADVERLRVARLDSQRQEEGLERELEAVDSDTWKKEMNIARLHEQVQNSCHYCSVEGLPIDKGS